MSYLDQMMAKGLKEEIVDSILADELGQYIDTLAGLETDEDIIKKCCSGGDDNE